MQATSERTETAAAEYLEGVRALLGRVSAAAPEIEAARQLPTEISDALREAGMFAAAAPKAWGGLELDPVTQARALEMLATADASAAWCAMIGCDTGYLSGFLSDDAGRELFADPTRASVFVINPTGAARPVDGGYKVTGRWTFASGSTHATTYAFGCVVTTETGPRMATTEHPEVRVIVVPATSAEVIDTWTTTGVRGSGSHDVSLTDVFVPEEHSFCWFPSICRRDGALYRYPMLFALKLGAVPLGIARGAIDDVIAIAATKRTLGSRAVIGDQGWLQTAVARAEIDYGQARAFYFESLSGVWEELLGGSMPSLAAQARLYAAQIGALERCTGVVDSMYRAAGSAAVYTRGTLDRRLRDIHTIGQHTMFSAERLAEVGREFLGVHSEGSSSFRR